MVWGKEALLAAALLLLISVNGSGQLIPGRPALFRFSGNQAFIAIVVPYPLFYPIYLLFSNHGKITEFRTGWRPNYMGAFRWK